MEHNYLNDAILKHEELIFQIFTFSVIASAAILGYGFQSYASIVTSGEVEVNLTPFIMLAPMAVILPCAFLISGIRQDIFRWGAYIIVILESEKVGYETLLDRIRDKRGRFSESYTPLFVTYWLLLFICSSLFIWGILKTEGIHVGLAALVVIPFAFLLWWTFRFVNIPSKPNRDNLKKEWLEAKKVADNSIASRNTDNKNSDTPILHPNLNDIEEHLKRQDRQAQKAVYVTGAAFGGSIGLVGISLWLGRELLSQESLFWNYVFLLVAGLGFMFWCWFKVHKIKD